MDYLSSVYSEVMPSTSGTSTVEVVSGHGRVQT